MSRNLKKYRLTFFLGVLFCGTFIYDTILRFQSGISFTDYLMGNNFSGGLFNYIWFKGSLVAGGEIWRIFTWPLLFKGFINFLIDFTLLILLLSDLEKRLGTFYTAIRVIVIHVVYTGMLWLTTGLGYSNIDIGFAFINLFLFCLIGLYIAERFINDEGKLKICKIKEDKLKEDKLKEDKLQEYKIKEDKIKEDKIKEVKIKEHKIKDWIVVGYVVFTLTYQIILQSSEYALLYALSIGIFINFLFNYKKCYILNRKLPIYKSKSCYVTYSIIAISILIFIFDLVLASKDLKAELYNNFSFSKWFNYFMYHTGDNKGAVSKWLCLNYADLMKGQVWRMFTLIYSHYGFQHILFNMPAIFLSGRYIESKYGSVKTLLIFEGSALFVSIYACITSINDPFSGFGGTSLGIYAFLIVFMLMLYENEQISKPHIYEMIYVVLYFILGNIPGIGVRGNNHLQSFLFGLIAFYTLKNLQKNTLTIKNTKK